ncbi:hypothetical protein K8I85_10735 [bacterium]|nr:hypothetical protein [bacterium]
MQGELDTEGLPVHILGVNAAGLESHNAAMCAGRDLPWLQDLADSANVWTSWNVVYRDVVILDRENQRIRAFNLTTHDLDEAADYEALKQLLRDAVAEAAP